MRHRKGNRKLSRPTDQRIALLRGLVKSLFEYKKIQTTDTRAKEARKMAEKLITLSKRGDLHARRLALQTLPHKDIVKDLFTNIGTRYENRNGGYTRLTKVGFRKGDGAPVSVLELVD
jgi:large subunit ribosomal protein L17